MEYKVAVAQDPETDSYAGLCECRFSSRGWPTEKIASERILQHLNEHETGELMEDLSEFRTRLGLVQSSENGMLAVFPEGAKDVTPKSAPKKGKK